jgi:hypothetical protein
MILEIEYVEGLGFLFFYVSNLTNDQYDIEYEIGEFNHFLFFLHVNLNY